MNDCPYCRQNEDGGIDILQTDVPMGDFGKLKLSVNFNTYQEPYIYLAAWLRVPEQGHGFVVGGESEIRPKFCFNCGRNLYE